MTQNDQILLALKKGARLTPLDALQKFGCMRLAARIYDLRWEGWEIHSRQRQLEGGKQCAEYRMRK